MAKSSARRTAQHPSENKLTLCIKLLDRINIYFLALPCVFRFYSFAITLNHGQRFAFSGKLLILYRFRIKIRLKWIDAITRRCTIRSSPVQGPSMSGKLIECAPQRVNYRIQLKSGRQKEKVVLQQRIERARPLWSGREFMCINIRKYILIVFTRMLFFCCCEIPSHSANAIYCSDFPIMRQIKLMNARVSEMDQLEFTRIESNRDGWCAYEYEVWMHIFNLQFARNIERNMYYWNAFQRPTFEFRYLRYLCLASQKRNRIRWTKKRNGLNRIGLCEEDTASRPIKYISLSMISMSIFYDPFFCCRCDAFAIHFQEISIRA